MNLFYISSIFVLSIFTEINGLTCYNGMKMLSMQDVGQSTEECSASGAYCYNMTASAMVLVNVVKAGCSTWRCMLARDRCISTYFQMVPVSLCCCSTDRCNIGGNPTGSIDNGNNDPNANFQNNYPQNDGSSDNEAQKSNWGTSWAAPNSAGGAASIISTPPPNKKWTKQEIEDRFKSFDVDQRAGSGSKGAPVDIEESFVKQDASSKAASSSSSVGGASTGSRAQRVQTQNNGQKDEITIP